MVNRSRKPTFFKAYCVKYAYIFTTNGVKMAKFFDLLAVVPKLRYLNKRYHINRVFFGQCSASTFICFLLYSLRVLRRQRTFFARAFGAHERHDLFLSNSVFLLVHEFHNRRLRIRGLTRTMNTDHKPCIC